MWPAWKKHTWWWKQVGPVPGEGPLLSTGSWLAVVQMLDLTMLISKNLSTVDEVSLRRRSLCNWAGSHLQVLNSDFGPRAAAAVMNRLAKLSARFIGERGFSIGIDDVKPADLLNQRKEKKVTDAYKECQVDLASVPELKLSSCHCGVMAVFSTLCMPPR